MTTRAALIVGIDEYVHSPLRFCTRDAEEMQAIVSMPEYAYDTRLVLNGKATRREILAQLNQLLSDAYDEVLFYFAGHGISTPFGTFLVTADFDPVDPGIGLDYLARLLRSMKADATAVVILDCCHSGSATTRALSEPQRSMNGADVSNAVHSLGAGRIVMAACQSHEGAKETSELRHGLFTFHLIDALCGTAADSDGNVSVTTLYEYVARRFESVSGQTPVLRGDLIGRVVLGRGLPPRETKELEDVEMMRIENQAEAMVNEYVEATAIDMERWISTGYVDACGRLEPLVHWLDGNEAKHVKLRLRPRFASAVGTAHAKLAHLGDIIQGMSTPLGKVVARLGSGTFGTVWRVQDGEHSVAYKVYNPSELSNKEKRQRFDRGFRAMKQMNHPHIVRVHQLTSCPVGFTMDLIQGPNAREYVAAEPEPLDSLRHLTTVAETLQHAHSRDVVHRDVKPENILLSWDVQRGAYLAFLTDFDLAWFSSATQFTKEGLGSFIYAAPEQIGKPRSNVAHAPTTDVYSFGQLLFFLLCSRDPVPHLADNTRALQRHLTGRLTEEACGAIVDLYDQCTRDNPSERGQDFRAICDVMFAIVRSVEGATDATRVDSSRFSRELGFSVAGAAPGHRISDTSFLTASGGTMVETTFSQLSTGSARIVLRLQVQQMFAFQGERKSARRSVNQRIDSALMFYKFAKRHPGRQNPFETYIHIENIPMSMAGVRITREVLTRVIDCIEGTM
jgi:serine/threonine protein kinase